ncbi:tRNA pseudouridine55 synthase [Pilibacter termitis]|uniref:tRNA pseudouridine synthase B n=1 Tax=Pilibacter termitis TaxID=263852 RepID=A0A1T4L9W4_9ENTE|nr:tRNA pseudouridine(55) synthase TruB [Pilibacter termitis]SJZ51400.1 tRNA pseudouridine55 synthase [Pilibacter termitis]
MDGILALWKPRGVTSHDCVFKLRKILKTKKIGHGGTLDPDVDGILPICIGKGTKVIEYMVDSGKVYEGEITLGFSTTTEDKSGEVVNKTPVSQMIATEKIDTEMQKFVGTITQIPPMYSAVKVNGKRLYEYARAGMEVDRPIRKAEIYSFERLNEPVLNNENQTLAWKFRVHCGKGTYVRTLAVDLGEKLGFSAHMSDLTRIQAAGLRQTDALSLSEVEEKMNNNTIAEFLQPIEVAIKEFPRIDLTEELYSKVKNGMPLSKETLNIIETADLVALFYREKVVSLYQPHPSKEGIYKPSKVLRNQEDD